MTFTSESNAARVTDKLTKVDPANAGVNVPELASSNVIWKQARAAALKACGFVDRTIYQCPAGPDDPKIASANASILDQLENAANKAK